MHVISRTFHLPKAGSSESEYEDAAYPVQPQESSEAVFRCAIADGATESSFSRQWARRLVRHFVAGTLTSTTFREVIPQLQQCWHASTNKQPLPWYAQEAASRGAFAAFLGLTLEHNEQGTGHKWAAVAMGDACVFQVRGDRLHRAFPLANSGAFSNRPFLLSTRTDRWREECTAIERRRGACRPEDEFYLATDALAQWFLHEHEAERKPWTILRDLDTEAQPTTFGEWVGILREERKLRNDDTTLIRVNVIE